VGLTGELEGFGLPELLQILAQGKKSGVLAIMGDASQGSLTLMSGRLVDVRAGETVGEDAFFSLLGNVAGRFSFSRITDEQVFTDGSTIDRTVDALLLEASQRGPGRRVREV
jgi:hypothetical protein